MAALRWHLETVSKGAQTVAGRRDMGTRQTVELTRPRSPPGAESGNLASPSKLRQAIPDSLFGDGPNLDPRKAAEIAHDAEKWKSLRPHSVANL